MCRRLLCLLILGGGASVTIAADYTLDQPLPAEAPMAGDSLGFSVAAGIAHNQPWLVAGALSRHATVWRAEAPGGVPTLRQTLLSDSTLDSYAVAVAASAAERGWLAIGALADDRILFNAGRVDVWGLDLQGRHQLVDQLLPPVPVETGNFGASVALAGDWLAVGEPKAFDGGTLAEVGAVHLYTVVDGRWQLRQSLVGDQAGGRFGQSVALSAESLIVGAPLFDLPGVADAGAVFFFARDTSGQLLAEGQGTATGAAPSDRLGISVDLDGAWAAAGSANDDKPAGVDAGSVVLFRRVDGIWFEQERVRSTQPQIRERFGESLSLRGVELLVGAYCLPASCQGTGAVYVFQFNGEDWSPRQRLVPTGNQPQSFGHALAHLGHRDAAVGAFAADVDGLVDSGLVYPLLGPPDAVLSDGFETALQAGP